MWKAVRVYNLSILIFLPVFWTSFLLFLCECMYLCVPAGHLAGTHTAAAAGAVGPFDAAKYSRDAADGGGPREPHPGCNVPAEV